MEVQEVGEVVNILEKVVKEDVAKKLWSKGSQRASHVDFLEKKKNPSRQRIGKEKAWAKDMCGVYK